MVMDGTYHHHVYNTGTNIPLTRLNMAGFSFYLKGQCIGIETV